jgi:hypothetical protein
MTGDMGTGDLLQTRAQIDEAVRGLVSDGWTIKGVAQHLAGLGRAASDSTPAEIWREVGRLLAGGKVSVSAIVSHLRALVGGPKATIDGLDPKIRAELDRLIREGSHNIDQIVAHLRGLGSTVSRSAVGRHKKKAEAALARYREAQQVAGVWVEQLGENPQGDVGKLLPQMLKAIAYSTMSSMAEEDSDDEGAEPVKPAEIMFLAKAIGEIERARKTSAETDFRIRAELAKEQNARVAAAAKDVGEVAREAGLSAERIEFLQKRVAGLRLDPKPPQAA